MRIRKVLMMAAALVAASSGAHAAGLRKGYAMCRDQKTLERLLGASVKGDEKTFGKLMRGSCRATKGSERIKIANRTKTLARISIKGLRGSWWTVVEAVR